MIEPYGSRPSAGPVGLEVPAGRLRIVRGLYDRATGGRDVAATPTDDTNSYFPKVPRAAGVDEAVKWLREAAAGVQTARMVFLVGGPGAGKSHAAAAAVEGLALARMPDHRYAQRTYVYALGDSQLVVVNDATIKPSDDDPSPLVAEIENAIANCSPLLVCVNRGVIVEELAAVRRLGLQPSPAQAILNSLAGPRGLQSSEVEGVWRLESPLSDSYLELLELTTNGRVSAEAMIVNVDACSLLEKRPSVTLSLGSQPIVEDYRVIPFVRHHELEETESSGNALFDAVADLLLLAEPWNSPAGYLDPFDANVRSFLSASVRSGIAAVARAAEIASGSLFSFRDLWGALARTLIGAASDVSEGQDILSFLERLQPTAKAPWERFEEIRRVASFRFSQALFGVGVDDLDAGDSAGGGPVERRFRVVDPAKDAAAGYFSRDNSTSGWATPVIEAFAGHTAAESPLEALLATAQEGDSLSDAVTDFDRTVDEAFRRLLADAGVSDLQRLRASEWYGRYMLRLYAVANGIPAFRAEVNAWTEAHFLSPALPSRLAEHLRTLIRPNRFTAEPGSMVPLLESRTSPIIGQVFTPKLALRSGSFEMSSETRGEELFLRIREDALSSPPMLLDFPMVRQALSCRSGFVGFTESADVTAPRLERFRSSQLLRRDSSEIVVVSSQFDHVVHVEGQ